MDERLFDIESIPEVPLLRESRRAHAARGVALDARFANDYPPEWNLCTTCHGIKPHAFVRQPGTGMNFCARAGCSKTIAEHDGWEMEPPCPMCLGMGSLKARVRLEAGHRCVRCLHPYMPKGDAKILGISPSPFHWSPCDPRCAHGAPIRWCEAHEVDDDPNWRYLDTLGGQHAGDGILDRSPSGEPIERYAVEAEWRILTVHHLDGDKANCRWWNLAALCQRCHLEIQAKVVMERVYPHEHSEWFKPYVAGYYAHVYLGEDLTREQVDARTDELLALELATERN